MSKETRLIVLVGTMSGTAQMVAEELQDAEGLDGSGLALEVVPMDTVSIDVFNEDALFLYCTSTYGTGDPPDNAKDFYQALIDVRPDLSSVKFGLVGLGDKKYAETFAGGPKKFGAITEELGAVRLGEYCILNASSGEFPEEVALEWFDDWLQCL
jgi:MioC protein